MPDQSQQPGHSQVNPLGSSTGTHFFQNAQHINIHGGTYIGVSGDVNIFHRDTAEYGEDSPVLPDFIKLLSHT
jgi:hypothetical protein